MHAAFAHAHTHTSAHTHASFPLCFTAPCRKRERGAGTWIQERGGVKQNERKAELRSLRWGRKRGSVQGEGHDGERVGGGVGGHRGDG